MPDWRSDPDHYVAEGDLVVEHFHATAPVPASCSARRPDGKTLILRGIHIFRIANDKIVERWGPAAAWSVEGEPSQGFGGPALDEALTSGRIRP